ncbi:hypothetical protein HTZ77_34685 [Nonomuraea sp. SMC257]|uniref:Uncharacterized protein n=1 Tax=Nonomuraea montanisoli TaxID=2741721 RepID=A0A7Y6IEA2_9ACTN|nr:hypothetical protein [Nonomuraea montanisoli]NUW36516.1 hypothetical protein [Nonomuraea montanisoli]
MFTSSRTSTKTDSRPVKALLTLATAGTLSVVLAASVAAPAFAADPKKDKKLRKAVRDHVVSQLHDRDSDSDDSDSDDADDADDTPIVTTTRHHHRRHLHLAGAGDDCNRGTFFKIHSLEPRHFYIPRTHFVDGPGGSVTASVHREHEVLAFVEADFEKLRSISTELTPDTIVRTLIRTSIPHLEKRHMIFTGHDYTHDIADGKYGNLWYRAFGYRIRWAVRARLDTCKVVRTAHGIADIPSAVEGWRYWETDKPMFHGKVLSEK